MPGTKSGARNAVNTNKLKDPHHYENIGRKGGSAKVPKGYSMAEKQEREANGRKGGKTPRKPKLIEEHRDGVQLENPGESDQPTGPAVNKG